MEGDPRIIHSAPGFARVLRVPRIAADLFHRSLRSTSVEGLSLLDPCSALDVPSPVIDREKNA